MSASVNVRRKTDFQNPLRLNRVLMLDRVDSFQQTLVLASYAIGLGKELQLLRDNLSGLSFAVQKFDSQLFL